MSLEKEVGLLQAARSNAELEDLVERIVETAIARIQGGTLKPFITCAECASLIGVTPEHLCAMRARGEGPPWSGAGKWTRYQRSAVLTWLANLPRDNKSLADDSNDPLASGAQPDEQHLQGWRTR
jgi:hypothetical protein